MVNFKICKNELRFDNYKEEKNIIPIEFIEKKYHILNDFLLKI
jgi:hypothetical protein